MIYRYYAERGGWRLVVLFHEGRKWIRLLEVSTFEVYRLPAHEIRRLRPVDLPRKRTARKIAQRRAFLNRCRMRFSKRAVQSAISKLNGAAGRARL